MSELYSLCKILTKESAKLHSMKYKEYVQCFVVHGDLLFFPQQTKYESLPPSSTYSIRGHRGHISLTK